MIEPSTQHEETAAELCRLRQEVAELKAALSQERRQWADGDRLGRVLSVYRAIYDQALHLSGIVGLDGTVQYANRAACEMIGLESSQVIGRPFWETPWWSHSAEEQERLRHTLQQAVQGVSVRLEVSHGAPDGTLRNLDFSLRPAWDETGQILCLVVEAWDITERKQAEEALDRTHLLLEAVIEQSPVPMVVASAPDHVMRYANQAAFDILGLSDKPSHIGLSLSEVQKRQTWRDFGPDGMPIDLLDMPLARALCGKTTKNMEYRIIRKDGTQRWGLASAAPIYSRAGELLAGLIVFPDITERKRAEEDLRASQAFLDTVIEQSPHPMWVSDDKGTLIRLNQACRDMLRTSEEDLVGKYNIFKDNIVEEQGAMPLVRRVFEEGERVRLTLHYDSSRLRSLRLSGTTEIDLEVTISPVLDARRRVTNAIIQHLDLTERKLALEKVRQLTNEQRTVLNTISMGISYLKNRKLQWVNPSFARMFGYEPNELDGMDSSIFYAVQEDYQRVGQEGYRHLTTGGIYSTEARMKKKDGTLIWCSITGQAINPRDLEEGSIWILHDITERRRTVEALQEQEERFKRLIQNSNDIIAVLNEKGVLTSISGPLQTILGYSPEELIGRSCFELIHAEDQEVAARTFAEIVTQSGVVRRAEFRYRHKDESWVAMEAVGTNLLHDPIVKGVVLNIRDISERNRLQGELQQAMKMEAVGRLAGGVAHDFNNLLTVINGNVELARLRLIAPDPLLQPLDEISRAAGSAASLTRQLLAFSRRQIIEPKVLNLNDHVSGLLKMVTRLIGEDIALQTALAEGLGSVKVDPGQFEQVMVNLAVNARDAMPEGGRLFIETANRDLDEAYCARHPEVRPGNFVLLAVSDTGYGMSEEVKQHLFEPFFTTKPMGKGTGLGLATIFGAVKQAGGTIDVYSEVGRGTTFKIYLPRVEEPAGRLDKETSEPVLLQGHETILLVEDEASVRELALIILKRLGYKVLHASNGGEAFMLAEKHGGPIDLLLTDVVMPGMNGRELAERLLKLHPEMKVLFTSGYTENVILHHGVVEDHLNFLGKPFSLQALADKVRGVLDAKDR